ncbi:hypothetical protein PUN28_009631 [Cardiocondyla obscurior]|uniref:Uncharacterized protein n=1 Tax=Cardiocondyla obscurior TaxID=286306 RepID=A0AAW2FT77_9HYME
MENNKNSCKCHKIIHTRSTRSFDLLIFSSFPFFCMPSITTLGTDHLIFFSIRLSIVRAMNSIVSCTRECVAMHYESKCILYIVSLNLLKR